MVIVSIVAGLILFFSFIGGLKEGAVKSFFSLIALIIALPISGRYYQIIANLLSFLPGENWQNFIGFFITLAIASVILHFIFFMPRKMFQMLWSKGCLSSLVGGILNLFSSAVGLTMLTLVLLAFPVWGWLEEAVKQSGILNWLVINFSFVQTLLIDIARRAAGNMPV